jgi:hypothetical protein
LENSTKFQLFSCMSRLHHLHFLNFLFHCYFFFVVFLFCTLVHHWCIGELSFCSFQFFQHLFWCAFHHLCLLSFYFWLVFSCDFFFNSLCCVFLLLQHMGFSCILTFLLLWLHLHSTTWLSCIVVVITVFGCCILLFPISPPWTSFLCFPFCCSICLHSFFNFYVCFMCVGFFVFSFCKFLCICLCGCKFQLHFTSSNLQCKVVFPLVFILVLSLFLQCLLLLKLWRNFVLIKVFKMFLES